MSQSNSSKQVLLSVIGVAILVVAIVGVSFAFFNYTRTGSENTITTGHIEFTTTQTTLTIENMFPITLVNGEVSQADQAYVDSAIVRISGNTTYAGGVDYRVSAINVTNTVATGVNLPISVLVSTVSTGSGAFPSGAVPTTYNYTNLANGDLLAEGHIPAQTTVTDAQIVVTAYLDASRIAITDTYNGTASPTDDYGTTQTWVNGRTVLTTAQWNAISSGNASISFKIMVEAVQGGSNRFQQTTSTANAA